MLEYSGIRSHCMAKPGTTEETPFDEITVTFKVKGKMYVLINPEGDPLRMNLKCDPETAEALRELHESVEPGYHMNKTHWNTVTIDGSIPDDEALKMIDYSYDLVAAGLPRAARAESGIRG
jgi:predicted DNA-binding protein (MmcQ/YjbR family)